MTSLNCRQLVKGQSPRQRKPKAREPARSLEIPRPPPTRLYRRLNVSLALFLSFAHKKHERRDADIYNVPAGL